MSCNNARPDRQTLSTTITRLFARAHGHSREPLMNAALHILLISERQADFDRIRRLLPSATTQLEHCTSRANAEQSIRAHPYDVVLFAANYLEAQQLLQER